MIHLSTLALTVVISTVIPFATGLVGKQHSGGVRAVLNGLLSAVAGGVTLALAQNGNVSAASWILNIGLAWGTSVVSYHGLWAPTGAIDAAVNWAAKLLAKVGIHLPVTTVETDIESLIAQLEALIQRNVSPATPTNPVVNISVSGPGTIPQQKVVS